MDAFVVRGGRPLSGTVRVNGAKNSALKVAAAALLAEGVTVIRNVPAIGDMRVMVSVLEHLGASVVHDGDAYRIDVPGEVGLSTPVHLARRLRASIVVLGPLLAREGRVRLAMPGGCNLGSRGIDMHLAGLTQMGAAIDYGPDYVEARAARLRGADIELPFASVGATENLLMAAVTADGTTRIINAAREPEIGDLAGFLTAMGADIRGVGSSELVIRGVSALQPTEHAVLPDRIEAGTYAVAAAVTAGEIRLERVVPAHMRLALEKLSAIGAEVQEGEDSLVVRGDPDRQAVDVVTLPYPGFPTDLQPQFLVLLSQSAGTSMLTENVYDGRFSIIPELNRLGADIEVEGHHAIVRGARRLRGAEVHSPDLRAGAALVIAGLVAEGETVVRGAGHVDRGYADFAGRLRALGADVHRAAVSEDAGLAAGAA
ncbi:MAG TPA: UDP-N-acetylglucosamine 1-carboxyvinyltransferase [Egibacteraceae bacterium]|nr:UDP-N-acetylglucosamine 1-carboxyvinyltransferase [Egibacteraceae bacterium]